MSAEGSPVKEDLIRAAWQRWFEEDFSWAGLKAKSWNDNQTLQDYWLAGRSEDDLRNAGEFIEVAGQKTYHLVHLPLHYQDGTPTLKTTDPEAVLARLDTLVRARLDLAVPDDQDYVSNVKDKRARFDGAVFLELDLSAENYQNLLKASFRHALYYGGTSFSGATFSGNANFEGATFSGYAGFRSAIFSDYAHFRRATFSGFADFSSATFSKYAFFESSTFSDHVAFYDAAFSQYTAFTWCIFSGDVSFEHALFEGLLDFTDSVFVGDLNLQGDGAAHLRPDQIQNLHLKKSPPPSDTETAPVEGLEGTLAPASLIRDAARRALPSIEATGATFLSTVNLSNRDIPSPSRFDFARLHGPIAFHGSRLHPDVTFHQCEFEGALSGFPKPDTLPEIPEAALKQLFAAHKKSNPAATEDQWRKSFDDRRKDDAIKQLETQIEQSEKILQERLSRHVDKPKWQNIFFKQNATKPQNEPITEAKKLRHVRDQYFSRLESAFRTLKLIMEERRDRTKEGEFFRLEIRARRQRRDIPLWERLASDLYALLSDYGNSISRPVFCLLVMMLVSGLGAYGLDGWLGLMNKPPSALTLPFSQIPGVGAYLKDASVPFPDLSAAQWKWDSLFSAMSFSLGNTAHPLSALSVEDIPNGSVAKRLLECYGEGWGFLTRLLAVGQSLLSIILIFLTALSVRRRFQIN